MGHKQVIMFRIMLFWYMNWNITLQITSLGDALTTCKEAKTCKKRYAKGHFKITVRPQGLVHFLLALQVIGGYTQVICAFKSSFLYNAS